MASSPWIVPTSPQPGRRRARLSMINRCCLPASKCCTACIESLTPKAPYKAVYEFPPSDRALRDIRRQAGTATRRRSAPSAAIRRSVPVRTFDDWDDPPPGFVEADLVAHSGPVARGSFVQTLVLTDIATGLTECAPLLVREQRLLTEVLAEIRKLLPFPLLW